MSGQHGQGTPARLPKSTQGPLKATIPISSVLKQNSSLKSGNNNNNNSPTSSPISGWRTRVSPDHSSGQRSPGSSFYKSKSKAVNNNDGTVIRRTASLDTIYLKGHWPRDSFYFYTGNLQVNKATQTDEADWSESRLIHSISESSASIEDKSQKVIRKIRTKESNGRQASPGGEQFLLDTSSQTLSSCILSPTLKANPVSISLKPLPKSSIRNSVEGLNQEIERICVLKSNSELGCDRSDDKFCQGTPEGHRAPLAELFRSSMISSRSVNTQTPIGDFPSSCHSSGPPSRESPPLLRHHLESPLFCESGGSLGSSPDHESGKLGTSPRINKFLAREPPDGCEKVHLKSLEDRRSVLLEHAASQPQPNTNFQLKPSQGSAFQILQPLKNAEEDNVPIVPQKEVE